MNPLNNIYQFAAKHNNGHGLSLDIYHGKVLLIVNTASQCGFTPQYSGLQTLQDKFNAKGFEVLAFPCDQFGHQEPDDDEQIAQFCANKFATSFPLFAKVEVNGINAHPLFMYLKKHAPGVFGTTRIKWNFTKFLVDNQGNVIKRYSPKTKPAQIEGDISALLPA
ncbi:glutathione peroxidase [Paraglaciecola polaris]|uniref:Glutathione peroxidase n=1 Tax=Paraglaciecola polaris LMG 21857 TaxID=1129793 RepID=K7A9E4_9ALTE|nr:glutathione peroxidase [Paraglaciecola polaris]GAC32040.1 glutathione peroxidase [Paraglaciecola polaris LMG 21857]|tara:strand:- start:5944 stop:6438 length:495 start_codon:yes stop_codon:yes gene_type:complete